MNEWLYELMNEWLNERMNERMENVSMCLNPANLSHYVLEWTTDWLNEWMNERKSVVNFSPLITAWTNE